MSMTAQLPKRLKLTAKMRRASLMQGMATVFTNVNPVPIVRVSPKQRVVLTTTERMDRIHRSIARSFQTALGQDPVTKAEGGGGLLIRKSS